MRVTHVCVATTADTPDLAVDAIADWWRLHRPDYPPGTSKWNPIEHRLFSQITATWAGFVLSTLAVLLGFIRRTTTRTGLRVTATHFEKTYQTGQRVSNAKFKAIQLTRHATCPQWNYTIRPRAGPENTE